MERMARTAGLLATIACVAAFTIPTLVSADAVSVQSTQLLPPGSNTCASVSVLNTQTYVYDGALNAFDVTVNSAANVAIAGTVGDSFIPFNQMTRRTTGSGVLIHVDTASIPLRSTTAITLTMLSAAPGAPVCATTISLIVPAAVQPTPPIHAYVPPVKHPVSIQEGSEAATATPTAAASKAPSILKASLLTTLPTLSQICTDKFRPNYLWYTFLAVYILLVGFMLANKPRDFVSGAAIIIFIPLIALLGLWYLVPECRAAQWMPLLSCGVAIVGLVGLYREREGESFLPATVNGTSALIVTPPAPEKKASTKAETLPQKSSAV